MGSILGVLVAGVVGMFAYAWQEHIKRNTTLAERRKELYENVLRCIFELLGVKPGPARSKLISEIEKSWLFASDDVLKALYGYLNIYNRHCSGGGEDCLAIVLDKPEIRKEFHTILSKVFLAMRRDIRRIRPTRINQDWADHHVRIYEWGIMAKPD